MVFWSPDTCLCKIEVDSNFTFVDWIKKCSLHQTLNNQELLNAILSHMRSFNYKFGYVELTVTQNQEITKDKQTEYNRIKLLGKGIEK